MELPKSCPDCVQRVVLFDAWHRRHHDVGIRTLGHPEHLVLFKVHRLAEDNLDFPQGELEIGIVQGPDAVTVVHI